MNPETGTPPAPPPAAEYDRLDWDARIDPAPPRPGGTIQVRLKYTGRSRPEPVEPPDAEDE